MAEWEKPEAVEPDMPLRVNIDTNKVSNRPGHGYFSFDVRQNDALVEFYQDGDYLYTACSGEIFGHEYFMQILGDVINAAMLMREGRLEEAELIGKRFQTSFWQNMGRLQAEQDARNEPE